MVAIDSSIGTDRQPVLNIPLTLSLATGAAALVLGLGTMLLRGFDEAGLRQASEINWRFASFVFAAAAVTGPLCRLIPLPACQALGAQRAQVIWSFCAAYAVYLAILVMPNVAGLSHDNLTSGMMIFSMFGGGIAAVLAWAAHPASAAQLGAPVQRALLLVAGAFFGLTYALTGLAHLVGPHRPDAFYGTSLSLMILVLLVRFADRFAAQLRGTTTVQS